MKNNFPAAPVDTAAFLLSFSRQSDRMWIALGRAACAVACNGNPRHIPTGDEIDAVLRGAYAKHGDDWRAALLEMIAKVREGAR